MLLPKVQYSWIKSNISKNRYASTEPAHIHVFAVPITIHICLVGIIPNWCNDFASGFTSHFRRHSCLQPVSYPHRSFCEASIFTQPNNKNVRVPLPLSPASLPGYLMQLSDIADAPCMDYRVMYTSNIPDCILSCYFQQRSSEFI